ncbi:MAG: ATP-binding protein [Pseudomonadota bacterium]
MQNVSEKMSPAPKQANAPDAADKAFEIELQSSELAVRDALGQLTSKLKTYACGPDETATVELVVAEILNNIVEHAFAEEEPEGTIRMNCAMADDGLHMQISDRGRPMPNGEMPLGNAPELNVEMPDLPEGGFGWFLIRDLAKDLAYRRENQTNLVSLRIAVGL